LKKKKKGGGGGGGGTLGNPLHVSTFLVYNCAYIDI
jgi:hypothetical protein